MLADITIGLLNIWWCTAKQKIDVKLKVLLHNLQSGGIAGDDVIISSGHIEC